MVIRSERADEYQAVEDLVYDVFKGTKFSDGFLERELVKEIRSSKNFIPKLSIVAVSDSGQIIGHIMMSKFPLSGKNEDKVLLLSPVSVDPAYQNQGIGMKMIETGLDMAEEMGFLGVIVEGSPRYYGKTGFLNYTEFGLSKAADIPGDYLMAQELVKDGFKGIEGEVDFAIYKCLA